MKHNDNLRHRVSLKNWDGCLIANVWAEKKQQEITIPFGSEYMATREIHLGKRIFTVCAITKLNETTRYLTFSTVEEPKQ